MRQYTNVLASMWPTAVIAAAALSYNVNLPSNPVTYADSLVNVTVNCAGFYEDDYTLKSTRLPDALIALNIVPPEADRFSCGDPGGTMTWMVRRAALEFSESMMEGAGSTFRTPGCADSGEKYFCPPNPCLLMEVDYQNYRTDLKQQLLGHTSCGAVFGRGKLSNRYAGTVPPAPVMQGEDSLFYPGSVRARSDPIGVTRNELSPLAPRSKYAQIHPKYSDVAVPTYAPIDGLGDLTAKHDFVRVGSTANGGNGRFCDGVSWTGTATNCVKINEEVVSDTALENAADYDNQVDICGEQLLAINSYNGMAVFISNYADFTNPTTAVQCFSCDPCVPTLEAHSSWKLLSSPFAVTLMRDRDLQLVRNRKLAQNLPVYRAGSEEDEDTFVCSDGTSWTVPDTDECDAANSPYSYPDHHLSCGCYRYFRLATLHNGTFAASLGFAPPSAVCCKWVVRQLDTDGSVTASKYRHRDAHDHASVLNALAQRSELNESLTCPQLPPTMTTQGSNDPFLTGQIGCVFNTKDDLEMTLQLNAASGEWEATDEDDAVAYLYDPLSATLTTTNASERSTLEPYDGSAPSSTLFFPPTATAMIRVFTDAADGSITYSFLNNPAAQSSNARTLTRHSSTGPNLLTDALIVVNSAAATAASTVSQLTSYVSPHHTIVHLPTCSAAYVFYLFNLSAVLVTPGASCNLATLLVADVTQTSWVDVGVSFAQTLPLALIGTDAVLQPCCPWYDFSKRDECAADPECNEGGNQCTMTAKEINDMAIILPDIGIRCQAPTSSPAFSQTAFIGREFAHLNEDIVKTVAESKRMQSTTLFSVPVDRRNEPFIHDSDGRMTVDGHDTRFESNTRTWGRVRRAYVVNPGDNAFDAIVIVVAESTTETFTMSYDAGSNGLRTWTVFVPGVSVADPCMTNTEPPIVQIKVDPVQTNAKVNPPSATAVWNVTVVITEACKQNVDNVCQMTSYGVSPAGVFDADMSDAPFYTTDDSGDNIRLKVSKDTDSSAAVEIDPNLLQTLYDFSLACAETGQCPPSPADFSGTAAEWARQYVAATNAQYPNIADPKAGLNFGAEGMQQHGDVSTNGNGEFCRWQYRDVRIKRAKVEQNTDDTPEVFMPFTVPCNTRCDAEVLGILNYPTDEQSLPAEKAHRAQVLRQMGPCSTSLLNSMNSLISAACSKKAKKAKGRTTLHACQSGVITDEYDKISFAGALNVQFSIDFTVPNAFNEWPDYCINGDRLSFSEITNSPGGSADVLNNIMVAYSWDMSGIPPDARPVGKQFPTNGRMDEFYKSFAEYTVSGYVDNSRGDSLLRATVFDQADSVLNSFLRDIQMQKRLVTKVLLFEYMTIDEGNAFAPIPIGIFPDKRDFDNINEFWSAEFGHSSDQANQDESLRTGSVKDKRKNIRFACQCPEAEERANDYNRDTANKIPLHEHDSQAYNNAPHFYKRCCRWSLSEKAFDPPTLNPLGTVKTLHDFASRTPDDLAADPSFENAKLWLSPYKRDRDAPIRNQQASNNQRLDTAAEDKPEGWTAADFGTGRDTIYRWVNHLDGFPNIVKAQCGTLAPENMDPEADAAIRTRMRMATPRGPRQTPQNPQQFAVSKVIIRSCTSRKDRPPLLAKQRVATTNPTVSEDYVRRPYLADIPNSPIPPACDCNGARPVYACQIYSEVEAFQLLGTGPFDLRPFPDAEPVVCGWSWDDVPNGGVNIGLFMGSTSANIFVMERDPLGDPQTASSDAMRFFFDVGAPKKEALTELITNVGKDDDFAIRHRKQGDILSGYTSDNGKVTIFRAKGTCMRAPYGRVHRGVLVDKEAHFRPSNNGGVSPEADETMYMYCEQVDGKFIFCDDDGMPYAERLAWCANHPNNNVISIGYVIGQRNEHGQSPDMVCRRPSGNDAAVTCLYIPGDPVNTNFETLILIAAQMEPGVPITMLVAPFNYTALENLQFAVRFATAGKGTSVFQDFSSGAWNQHTETTQGTPHAHNIDVGAMGIIKNISSAPDVAAVRAALQTVSTFYANIHSTYTCPTGQQAGPVAVGGVQTDEYACYTTKTLTPHIADRNIVIDVPDVTVEGPGGTDDLLVIPPTTSPSGASQCTVFIVSAVNFRVGGRLLVDNTGCNGADDHEQIPLRFFGTNISGASVTVAPAGSATVPAAVTMLGYNPNEGVLSRQLLDVTNVAILVEPWPKFELGFAAAVARVDGTTSALIDCTASCTVMLQEAHENDADLISFGSAVTIFDASNVIERFAHEEQRALKRSNQRQQTITVVWFTVAALVAGVALVDWFNSGPSTYRTGPDPDRQMGIALETKLPTRSRDRRERLAQTML